MGRRKHTHRTIVWSGIAADETVHRDGGHDNGSTMSSPQPQPQSHSFPLSRPAPMPSDKPEPLGLALSDVEDRQDHHDQMMLDDSSSSRSEYVDNRSDTGQENYQEENQEEFDALFTEDAMNAEDVALPVPQSFYEVGLSDTESEDQDQDQDPEDPPTYSEDDLLQDVSLAHPSSTPPDPEVESVNNALSKTPISLDLLVFGLFCERSSLTRNDYKHLREVVNFSMNHWRSPFQPEPEVIPVQLPLKIDTLKRLVRTSLPMLRLMRKPINVRVEKQGTLAAQEKSRSADRVVLERKSWHYWYDPISLFSTILNATILTAKMHRGMARYVDFPDAFWESRAWGSSAMTTSGDFAHCLDGSIALPGDIVRLASPISGCSKGRIIFVGREYRGRDTRITARAGVVLTLQPVRSPSDFDNTDFGIETIHRELFLIDGTFETTEDNIACRLDVIMEWSYRQEDAVPARPGSRYRIRYLVNLETETARPIRHTPPTRAELEVKHYGRSHIEAFAAPEKLGATQSISLPYILFIDDFGIHRNNYRAVKGFYITPANLSYEERRIPANTFTLTLGPHGAAKADIINNIAPGLQKLEKGLVLDINGVPTLTKAFVLLLNADMPEAADNSGFMRHSALRGCRACLIKKSERHDLDYDIITNGRFHFDIIYLRKEGKAIPVGQHRKTFFQDLGMREDSPEISTITPTLDLVLGRGYDAPHSEWRGIGRVLVKLLLENILSTRGEGLFIKAFQSFPFPYSWPRIQSPKHLFSWSLSETGRAIIIIPLLLRCHADVSWFKPAFMSQLAHPADETPFQTLISLFGVFALVLSETSHRLETPITAEDAERLYRECRVAFKTLVVTVKRSGARFAAEREDNVAIGPVVIDSDRSLIDGMEESEDEDPDPVPDEAPARGKWDKLLSLPNVHVGLHLADNIREYGHIMNSNVLVHEYTHQKWKEWADSAAPPQLMAYLFSKDVVLQSLRLGFAGAWDYQFPDLAAPLQRVSQECPILLQSFVPPIERELADSEVVDGVVETPEHSHVRVDMKEYCIAGTQVEYLAETKKILALHTLPPDNEFSTVIRQAFAEEYGIRNIVRFGQKDRVQWYKRVAFTYQGQKRHVFQVGDFCRDKFYDSEHPILLRIKQLAVVRFQNKRYLFFICIRNTYTTYDDHILPSLEVFEKNMESACFIGLHALRVERDYIFKAPKDGRWADTIDDDGELMLYYRCKWRLDYQ